jgi:hypothetical protein
MAFSATPNLSKRALFHETLAFMNACMVRQMPDDWPEQKDTAGEAADEYELAKRLDARLPDPTLLVKGLKKGG